VSIILNIIHSKHHCIVKIIILNAVIQ
jgi:hypothetical protein